MDNSLESGLPLEKLFVHRQFQDQIKTISLPEALKLLEELHVLYLSQQSVVTKLAKVWL